MPYVERRGNSIRVKWWSGEYVLDADGKPTKKKRYESASGPEPGVPFQDEDEAYTFGLDRESDVRNGRLRRRNVEMSMVEYCDVWIEATDVRVNSERMYRSILRSVIKPYWQQWTVAEITPIEYEAFKRHVRGEYSESYATSILAVFRMLMNDAVLKYRLREESPILEQRRRGRYQKKQTKRAKRELPFSAVHQLAVNAYHTWGYAGWVCIWTLAFTGIRPPGEMIGLQRGFTSVHWPTADPDRDRRDEAARRYAGMHAMRVQHQLYYVDGKPTLAAPKYDSHRTLVIPPFLHGMHSALLASHDQPWLFVRKSGKGHLLGVSFTREYWYPIRDGREGKELVGQYARFSRCALPAVEELEGAAIYRLRHWHKELLDEAGDIPRVAVEARMGHELPGVEGVYSRVTVGMETRIVEYLQAVWEKQVVARGLWTPPFPTRLPDDLLGESSPLFSGLPVIDSQ